MTPFHGFPGYYSINTCCLQEAFPVTFTKLCDMLLKAVTFSFDDGVTQDAQMIELMNKYGIKSTFHLNSELLGTHRFWAIKGIFSVITRFILMMCGGSMRDTKLLPIP